LEDSNYKLIIVAALGLGGVVAFLLSRNPGRDGLLLFLAALGLGYRTVSWTRAIRIQPAEIAILLVVLITLGKRAATRPGVKVHTFPAWLWALVPFMILAALPRSGNPFPWDVQLAECINVILVFPVFAAVRAVLAEATNDGVDPRRLRPAGMSSAAGSRITPAGRGNWRPVIAMFYLMATGVAVLGILEQIYPGIKGLMPGFVTNTEGSESDGGFIRAGFSFYGSPIAVFLCILAVPFSLVLWQWWRSLVVRLIILGGAGLQLGGIYISGYRSMWLLTAVLASIFMLGQRLYIVAILVPLVAVLGQQYMPTAVKDRLGTLEKIMEGRPEDSSGEKRLERIKGAYAATVENPLGGGWASAGWAHSDFLQISANLGVIPGVIFLGGYLHTLVSLGMRLRVPALSPEAKQLGFALLLSFVAVGQMLAVQGVEFQSFTIMPVWLLWAMVHTWLWQTAPQTQQSPSLAVRRRLPSMVASQASS
jgi:hypothetical protein